MEVLEGSKAIAEMVKRCKPAVVSAYPITPQTHIVEDLAYMKADGELDAEYVRAESEFAAASIVLGASATGVRVYTATSSQGLLLMAEVLYNVAGMRLPIVLTCANRALSAPINIWNDQQDAVTVRDSGWLQLFAETNQEACDMHVQAYKIAEETELPVMVNVDGFTLTHTFEPVQLLTQKQVDSFLPAYKPKDFLDPKNPKTYGYLATPDTYMEIRQDLFDDVVKSEKVVKRVFADFKKKFGRGDGDGLVEKYRMTDAEIVLVGAGSVCGTLKEVVDELRKQKVKVGVLKLRSFRPFPDKAIVSALSKAKHVAVLDKSVSMGEGGIFANEIKDSCYGQIKAKIQGFVVGLGGRDVTPAIVKKIAKMVKGREKLPKCVFVGKA